MRFSSHFFSFIVGSMSIIPPSISLVRFDNPVLITSPSEKKALLSIRSGAGTEMSLMDSATGGSSSPRLPHKQTSIKDMSLEEILDKILPPR